MITKNTTPILSGTITFIFVLLSSVQAANENDHLNPLGKDLEPEYQELLSDFLFKTPASFARIVRLPSVASDGELAISLDAARTNGAEARITCTRADRNIWSAASDLDRGLRRRPRLRVSRSDAAFPRALAETVSTAIRQALERRAPLVKTGRIPIHGIDILFSAQDRRGKLQTGILDTIAEGPTSHALRRLEELLRQYCEAKPNTRANLESKIEAEAKRVAEK